MRILHTMLRVGDLQRSIDFYTQVMGMTLPKAVVWSKIRALRRVLD